MESSVFRARWGIEGADYEPGERVSETTYYWETGRDERMWVLLMGVCRSMVYVEGEASMRKFQREEGVEQNALSIVQRLYSAK